MNSIIIIYLDMEKGVKLVQYIRYVTLRYVTL
jgi:hypothetical protein